MTGGFIKHFITISRTTGNKSDGRIHPNLHRFQVPLRIGTNLRKLITSRLLFLIKHTHILVGLFVYSSRNKILRPTADMKS